ncbi:MAG: ferrochelatase [Actinomycetota bacterium]|nr:ferrochelatase [Actinomycetota bacterium]
MAEATAVLVMAYGTPRTLDEVEPYYTDIRRGRPPPPELLEELVSRYRAIGGHSPLYEITEAQRRGLESRLGGIPTWLGQKHAAPFIPDAMASMAAAGIEMAVGLVLAPHYSSMSIGDYAARARAAGEAAGDGPVVQVIPSWHLEPGYIGWLAGRVREALASLPGPARLGATVIFTAHSLPARILEQGDPYPEQLAQTAEAVARELDLDEGSGGRRDRGGGGGRVTWTTGWQSAGRTAGPWIGPDVLDVMEDAVAGGASGIVICPCGFVADHLEVLYDIDIECSARARELGISLTRTRAPNDDPAFLDVLASVVRRALAGEGETIGGSGEIRRGDVKGVPVAGWEPGP